MSCIRMNASASRMYGIDTLNGGMLTQKACAMQFFSLIAKKTPLALACIADVH
jgi:hypothetical protein